MGDVRCEVQVQYWVLFFECLFISIFNLNHSTYIAHHSSYIETCNTEYHPKPVLVMYI